MGLIPEKVLFRLPFPIALPWAKASVVGLALETELIELNATALSNNHPARISVYPPNDPASEARRDIRPARAFPLDVVKRIIQRHVPRNLHVGLRMRASIFQHVASLVRGDHKGRDSGNAELPEGGRVDDNRHRYAAKRISHVLVLLLE